MDTFQIGVDQIPSQWFYCSCDLYRNFINLGYVEMFHKSYMFWYQKKPWKKNHIQLVTGQQQVPSTLQYVQQNKNLIKLHNL
jgi:hypothetical protein